MGRRLTVLCLTAAFLLAASTAEGSYRGTLSSVTHRAQLYSFETFDAEIVWYGTFFDDGFRRAFIDKTVKIKHMEPHEAALFRAEQESRQESGWDFFVVMYTKKDYKKFSLEPDTIWKALLTTGSGESVRPTEIEQVPISPYLKVVYPHFNRWSKAYRVTFPKVELGNQFWLTMQSVVGESSMKWVVQTAAQRSRGGGNKYRRR
ncbi:MAG TPA: hypothetical protein PLZ86_03000 [bacterium]|nr:hypothetical protein [bacterium]